MSADDDDEDVPSYEDLLQQVITLQATIEDKDEEIAQLTQASVGRGRKGGKGGAGGGMANDDYAIMEQDMKELREKQEKDKVTIKQLREDLATANAKTEDLVAQNKELDRKVKSQVLSLEQLQRENADLIKRAQSIENQTKEINKQKSVNVKMSQQLTYDNETLRDEIESLKTKLEKLQAEKKKVDEVLVQIAEEKEGLEADRNNLDVEKEEMRLENAHLQSELDEAQIRIQELEQAEAKWNEKYESNQKELQSIQMKFNQEAQQHKAENEALKKQIIQMKETTKVGQLQKNYEDLLKKSQQDAKLIESLRTELENTVADAESLSAQIQDTDKNIDQKVANKIASERQKVKTLEAAIERMKEENKANSEHYDQLEHEKHELSKQVDELMNWKAIYEAGHGLQQLSRNQKKLSDDNRRLTKALEEQTNRVGMLMDTNNALSLSFDRLKKEAGKPADFKYADLDLYQEIQSTTYALQMQVKELEDQLNNLENENTKMRKMMRDHIGSITEQGFKYAGLNPDQLLLVNEFALNLRDGKVTLPLEDRSKKLLEDNKKLKSDIQALQQKLAHIEETGGDSGMNGVISDTFGSDIKTLLHENSSMHQRMKELQDQLDSLLKKQVDGGMIKVDDLSAILSQNNELVLKELEELRRHPGQRALVPAFQQPVHHFDPTNNNSLPPSGRIKRNDPPSTTSASTNKRDAIKSTPAKSGKLMLDLTPARPVVDNRQPTGGTPFWTPHMNNGGMPFMATGGSQFFPMTPGSQLGTLGPNTPHGKQLLNNTLYNLNLPPEEWTSDVKELSSQLIECMEQLYERETELEEQRGIMKTYEESLGEIKIQMVAMYHDYAMKKQTWQEREKVLKEEHKQVNEERDDLKLKLRRTQEMIETLQSENPDSIESKLTEMTRKVIIYEVNESILSRKYISVAEQLEAETKRRIQLQQDFTEMESSLKQRILFLEQYKLAAGSRLAYIQGKLDQMIPQDDYIGLQHEMDSLREDHLHTLRREVEARIAALNALDRARELRSVRILLSHVQADLEKSKAYVAKLEMELAHERDSTAKAMAAMKSSAEVASIVTEMANFRGEASRLEVEVIAANKRNDLLNKNIQDITSEVELLSNRVKELEAREEDYSSKESLARKELLELRLQYEGGMTREQKEQLQQRADKLQHDFEEAHREIIRQKELVDIAMLQVQSLTQFKQSHIDEMKELREYCSRLESRSDDEVLIGRLQRQLMSTKASYKAFVRKYQSTRETMRKREIASRLLETKLIEMERLHVEALEKRHVEMAALKKALREVKGSMVQSTQLPPTIHINHNASSVNGNDVHTSTPSSLKISKVPNKGSKYFTIGVGAKLVEISSKVDTLAELAEDSVARAAEKEDESRKLSAEVEDLQSEKANLTQRIHDLEVLHAGGSSKQQAIAGRLISLSEECRVHKLTNLQQRRQILTMREEIKHLRSVIGKMEENSIELEKGKVDSEVAKAHALLHSVEGDLTDIDKLLSEDDNAKQQSFAKNTAHSTRLSIDTMNLEPRDDDASRMLDPGLVGNYEKRIVELTDQLNLTRKDLSNAGLKLNNMEGRSSELETLLQEKEDQLSYYEKVLMEENLQRVILRVRQGVPLSARGSRAASPQRTPHNHLKIMPEEQEKLQEAASATIGSLKALLEEKNRLLERYREKIDHLLGQQPLKSRAERRADELLDKLSVEDERAYLDRIPDNLRGLGNPALEESNRKLMEQLEKADSIIAEKERNLHQAEQQLMQQNHQRERAELRCGEVLKEMEAMKEDMMTLVRQLQESEARCTHYAQSLQVQVQIPHSSPRKPTPGPAPVEGVMATVPTHHPADAKKIKDLEKVLKTKDEKIKGYREIIVRLKEEFIKSEEEKAASEVQEKYRREQQEGNLVSGDELRSMKSKIQDLHEGLKQARQDVEKAKKSREKLQQEKQQTEDDKKQLAEELEKTASQLQSAQNLINKHRRDLEESKRKEVKLREKLKEFLAQGGAGKEEKGGVAGLKNGLQKYKEQMEELKAEMALLKAQNAALRRAEDVDHVIEADLKAFNSNGPKKGHVLGEGPGGEGDELRQQLHSKWEQEKKLQKRLGLMEKRLLEVNEENTDLKQQLLRLRDQVQQHQEATAKHGKAGHSSTSGANTISSATTQGGGKKVGGAPDLSELAEAQGKIFQLEDRIQVLTRKAEVEQVNQIRQLNHQLSISQGRIQEYEKQLAEYEETRKKSHYADTRGGSSLRQSEDRFLAQERLRDELQYLKRCKSELEAGLLERDSKALELQFECESAEIDIQRYKRRISELESQVKAMNLMRLQNPAANNATTTGEAPRFYSRDDYNAGMIGLGGTVGGASKRESELENVVDNMKHVIDKLRAENERLRRGIHNTTAAKDEAPNPRPSTTGAGGGGGSDAWEKKFNAEKKKAEKLASEMTALQTKLTTLQNVAQRQSQLQQQVSSLRTQLTNKEKLCQQLQQQVSELEERIQQHQSNPIQSNVATIPSSTSNKELEDFRKQQSILKAENDVLKAESSSLRQQLHASNNNTSKVSSKISDAESTAIISALQKENEKLRQELSAFDLDFFEEIENLKFAHAEAIRKLRMYEQQHR